MSQRSHQLTYFSPNENADRRRSVDLSALSSLSYDYQSTVQGIPSPLVHPSLPCSRHGPLPSLPTPHSTFTRNLSVTSPP
ncbi:hypothetical protein M404DRAFT_994579 [Pisolithus tinctorius Marx 270]|uniref:Uncharacterized protein n=1 Tax=Pisolithus tinctorius Marx 270 TaxID=870435 RepID=A0A0C3PT75_PISTI|nr:hypothetical protein M404DRAFT_994579 [Pisolithus tinctorius Marx 270]